MATDANGGTRSEAGGLIELYQAEWCPYSHSIRQRLTELGVDFIARQVPVARAARKEMAERTGTHTIPALLAPDTDPIQGEEAILAYLDERFAERPDADDHRTMARSDVPNFREARERYGG